VASTNRWVIATYGAYSIAGGGGLLYASEAVVHAGSWAQSTEDAFGVGMVIGGLVDVLVIALLSDAFSKSTGLLYGTGGVLVAGGAVCLYLSWAAATGSWAQGTLDAFGVGLAIGGFLDVLTIQGWNRTEAKRAADEEHYVERYAGRIGRGGR
jgi:hypothetical protein